MLPGCSWGVKPLQCASLKTGRWFIPAFARAVFQTTPAYGKVGDDVRLGWWTASSWSGHSVPKKPWHYSENIREKTRVGRSWRRGWVHSGRINPWGTFCSWCQRKGCWVPVNISWSYGSQKEVCPFLRTWSCGSPHHIAPKVRVSLLFIIPPFVCASLPFLEEPHSRQKRIAGRESHSAEERNTGKWRAWEQKDFKSS